MGKLIKEYLLYTFSIMLVCWGICWVCSLNNISLNDHYLLYIPYLLGGLSPTIASFISLKKNNKVKGFKNWIINIFDFKHSIFSYLMVAILGIIFILPQCLISGYNSGAPLFAIVAMLPVMLFGGGLEEAGWRYILQSELEKKHKFIASTIIVLFGGCGISHYFIVNSLSGIYIINDNILGNIATAIILISSSLILLNDKKKIFS